jgi:hypothetical protein
MALKDVIMDLKFVACNDTATVMRLKFLGKIEVGTSSWASNGCLNVH